MVYVVQKRRLTVFEALMLLNLRSGSRLAVARSTVKRRREKSGKKRNHYENNWEQKKALSGLLISVGLAG